MQTVYNTTATKSARNTYYRLIDRRSVWLDYLVKCDATAETAEVIQRLDKLATTSHNLDWQRSKYSKRTDYVLKRGRLYLVDDCNNALIPQSIEEFIEIHI